MIDYDGFVSDWRAAKVIPAGLQGLIDLVKSSVKKSDKMVELGCGNGIVTAALTDAGYDIVGVDRKYPGVEIPFLLIDAKGDEPLFVKPVLDVNDVVVEKIKPGWSADFFALLSERDVIVARRSLCLMYSDEWTARLNESPVKMMVIESLDGEKHRFRSSVIEGAYLESHGWEVTRDGKYLVASRKTPKKPH